MKMLVRAAGRHAQARSAIIRDGSSNLVVMPWLYPSQIPRCRRQHSAALSDGSISRTKIRRRRNVEKASRPLGSRTLATAVDWHPLEDVPFEDLSQRSFQSRDLSQIRPFDPNATLRLSDGLATAPPRYRVTGAIGGETDEMLSTLQACLQVGRLERAAMIIKRMSSLNILSTDRLTQLHTDYIRASVQRMMVRPSVTAARTLHKWFQLEVRNNSAIIANTEMVAWMLKASLLGPSGSRQERQVRRYMEMVPGDAALKVLAMDNIISAEDINQVTHIATTYNISANSQDQTDETYEVEDDYITADDELGNRKEEESHVDTAILAVSQKGLGLSALKDSLTLFNSKPADFDITRLDAASKRARQEQLENDSLNAAINRWREESANLLEKGHSGVLQSKSAGARMWAWQEDMTVRLVAELARLDETELNSNKSENDWELSLCGPFLRYLPADKLAATTILTLMNYLTARGIDRGSTLSACVCLLGKSVESESNAEMRRNMAKMTQKEKAKGARLKKNVQPQLAKLAKHLNATKSGSLEDTSTENAPKVDQPVIDHWTPVTWSREQRVHVGSYLLSTLMDVAKITVCRENQETKELVSQLQPAFTHAYHIKHGKKIGVIMANSTLVTQLQREPVHALLTRQLPMVSKPEPWSLFNKGGYLTAREKVMRIKNEDKDQRAYMEAAISRGNLEQVFKGLDVLGKTAWMINGPVYNTMLAIWNSGEAIANISPANPKLDCPPEPESSADPSAHRAWIRKLREAQNFRSGLHSQRCFQNFQIEIARAFRDEKFYFPHNVDFRGRAYPVPPILNHMGADHCRGLLMFGEGKELGDVGLKWLKVQLANVFGYDKASLKERESFAMDHMDDIIDSATKPVNGDRWWLKAEDPWQCLAACIELKSALASPDPARFVSHLPIHQDGTCNGLQHYAALGGDTWGAKQVNLEPSDRPADVYSAVAELVKHNMAEDFNAGVKFAQILDGKITRKVVKQTVMTNVYGVTFVGAQAQILKQLINAYPDLPTDPECNPSKLAAYIARLVFKALGTMFSGAHDIQYWLGECASRISMSLTPEQVARVDLNALKYVGPKTKSRGLVQAKLKARAEELMRFKSSVIWTSPLQMPIVQPYRQEKTRAVKTNLQTIAIRDPHRCDPIHKRKQMQAFPPNFIHSLDATHMLLSALTCHERGLSFAAVHDSFWTHASDIEKMNEILRDAFVRIHSEDVIGRLAAEFKARYSGGLHLASIKSNTKFAKKVKQWRTKRAKTNADSEVKALGLPDRIRARFTELVLERQRLRLLASSDPEEVAKGKAMVTPGSIYEQMSLDGDLAAPASLEEFALGTISEKPRSSASTIDSEDGNAVDTDLASMDDTSFVDLEADDIKDSAAEDIGIEESDEQSIPKVRVSTMPWEEEKWKKKAQTFQWAWVPLMFPPVPKKGDFDVSRLKKSDYFFS